MTITYHCEICSYSTQNPAKFQRHNKTRKHAVIAEGMGMPTKCSMCDKLFVSKSGAHQHELRCDQRPREEEKEEEKGEKEAVFLAMPAEPLQSHASVSEVIDAYNALRAKLTYLTTNFNAIVSAKVDAIVKPKMDELDQIVINAAAQHVRMFNGAPIINGNNNTVVMINQVVHGGTNVVINHANTTKIATSVAEFLATHCLNAISINELARLVGNIPICDETNPKFDTANFEFAANRAAAFNFMTESLGDRRPVYHVVATNKVYVYDGAEWVEESPRQPGGLLITFVRKSIDAALVRHAAYYDKHIRRQTATPTLQQINIVVKSMTVGGIRTHTDDIIADKMYGNYLIETV